MGEDPEPPPHDDEPSEAQLRRAEALRREIRQLGGGGRPPRTPREMTDEAARAQWRREQGSSDAARDDG
jgi:hypothetical protein